jgi:hypothetical protein
VSNVTVLRIRWSAPEGDVSPLSWINASLITATLFLNFLFCYESSSFGFDGTLPVYLGFLVAVASLIPLFFFAGPALASQTAGRPLFDVVESSLGSIPGWGSRLCCGWFLTVWIAVLISFPASRLVTFILRRDATAMESAVIGASLVAFLFATGLQGHWTNAKLAIFSNKLSLAILLAALIRVREGLPLALHRLAVSDERYSTALIAWHSLTLLALSIGPLAFLAADFGYRMKGRKQVAMTGGMGIALPLCGTLLLIGVIGAATHDSSYYVPSLQPTIAMALWSQTAGSALPGRMMIAAITLFGAVRFGARALANSVSVRAFGRRLWWVPIGCICGVIVWCSLHSLDEMLMMSLRASAGCIVVVAGVLTADFISGRRLVEPAPRMDWIGSGALLAGLATAFCVPLAVTDPWWQPGLLPSYGVGFTTCLLGRMLQKKFSGAEPSL